MGEYPRMSLDQAVQLANEIRAITTSWYVQQIVFREDGYHLVMIYGPALASVEFAELVPIDDAIHVLMTAAEPWKK